MDVLGWRMLLLVLLWPGFLGITCDVRATPGTLLEEGNEGKKVPEPSPNLLVEASGDFLNTALNMHVQESHALAEFINGNRIEGTFCADARLTLELVPDANEGMMDLVINGLITGNAETIHPPVRFLNNAVIPFQARKRLRLDSNGIQDSPTVSQASAHIELDGVTTKFRSRILDRPARRVATRRFERARPVGEERAARRIEGKIDERVEQESMGQIGDYNKALLEGFRTPLEWYGIFPQDLHFSTSSDYLHGNALLAEVNQTGSTTPPPALKGQPDIVVRAHETLINNAADTALAGKTLKGEDLDREVARLLGPLGHGIQPRPAPWTITCDKQQPLTIRFADHGFNLTIRASEFHWGDKHFSGRNITVHYHLSKTLTGIKAVRQGTVGITPRNGPEKMASFDDQVVNTALGIRFGKVFRDELVLNNLPMPEKLSQAGPFVTTQGDAEGGWMILAWTQNK